MKRVVFFCMLALAMVCASAQTETVTIGTGTIQSYNVPVNSYYKNSWTEMIYTGVGYSGVITSIAFDVAAAPSTAYSCNTFKVYLGTTSRTTHADNADWQSMSGLTEVFSRGNYELPTVTGWHTIPLDVPFSFDGSENLVVVISKTMPDYTNALKYKVFNHSNATLFRRGDTDPEDLAGHPGSNTGTLNAQLPNIQLTFTVLSPDYCGAATNIQVDNITHNSATVTWEAGQYGTPDHYVVEYAEMGSDAWTTATTTATSYALTGLSPNTNYTFGVAKVCDGGQSSGYSSVGFQSGCPPYFPIPYTQNFDTYGTGTGTYPDCWKKVSENAYPYLYASNAYSGSASLRSYVTASVSENIAILPLLDENVPLNQLVVSFMHRHNNTNTVGSVGVMTDPTDPTTFEEVYAIDMTTDNDTWNAVEVYLDSYTGTGHYIAIRFASVTGLGYNYVDALTVDYIPSCAHVENLTVDDITHNTATVAWAAGLLGTPDHYVVEYAETGSDAWTTATTTEISYTLAGLTPNTNYTVRVAEVCDNGQTSEYSTRGFKSECSPLTVIPYTENFDSYGTGSGSYPDCWKKVSGNAFPYLYANNAYNGAASLRSYVTTSVSENIAILPLLDESVSLNQLIVTFLHLHSNKNTVGSVGVMTDPTDPTTFEEVYAIDMTTDNNTWNAVEVYLDSYTGSGHYIAIRFTSATGSGYNNVDALTVDYIPSCSHVENLTVGDITHNTAMVTWDAGLYGTPDHYVVEYEEIGNDGLTVWSYNGGGGNTSQTFTPDCGFVGCETMCSYILKLTDSYGDGWNGGSLTITQNGNTVGTYTMLSGSTASYTVDLCSGIEAVFTYTAGSYADENTIQLIKPQTPPPATTITTTEAFCTLTGLSPLSYYTVRVAKVCDDGETSQISSTEFRSGCPLNYPIPYTENFDNYGTGNNTYPDCWKKVGGNQDFLSPIHYNAPASLRFFTQNVANLDVEIAILPLLDESVPLNQLMVTFMHNHNNMNTVGSVGVMTDPTDPTTFEEVYAIDMTTDNDTWNKVDAYLGGYSGTGHYIAIRFASVTGLGYNYVDSLTVDYIPSCTHVENLTVGGITHNSATVTWEAGPFSIPDHFVVEYAETGSDVWTTVTTTETSYTLTGLIPSTAYTVNVLQDCGTDGPSTAKTINVTTYDTPSELPYFTDFAATSDQNWKLENGICTNYWMMGNPDNSDTTHALFVTDNGSTAHYNISSHTLIYAGKTFHTGEAEFLNIEFDVQVGGESNYDYLVVYLAPASETYTPSNANVTPTSVNAIDLFEYVDIYRLWSTDGFVHVQRQLPVPSNDGYAQLVFCWRSDNVYGDEVSAIITNVSVSEFVCRPPETLTFTNQEDGEYGQKLVEVSWNGATNQTMNAWFLSYAPADADVDWNSAPTRFFDCTFGCSTISSQFELDKNTLYDFRLYAQCGAVSSRDIVVSHCVALTEDKDIILYYGACDTVIPSPELWPEGLVATCSPAILDTGVHTVTWAVVREDGTENTFVQQYEVTYPECSGVVELDGDQYALVRVGCECWMAENLRTEAEGAAYYQEDESNMAFGRLYPWSAAVGDAQPQVSKTGAEYVKGVCPEGWAIPTPAQFNTMLANAGGDQQIKSDDESTWLPGYAGTNESGFGAMGAGFYAGEVYQRKLGYTYFWTSEFSTTDATVAKTMELRCGCGEFTCLYKSKDDKFSVRCVKIEPNE